MRTAFRMGAIGLCVAELQRALGVRADGIFGPRTREAVERVEGILGREITGEADADVFAACQIPWPDEFRRCLTLTSAFEGTSYGDCNPADSDGAGLTFGVIGFTTAYGEVQRLIAEFLAAVPEALQFAPAPLARDLGRLVGHRTASAAWERVLLDHARRVRPEVRAVLAAWGTHPAMQQLQERYAREQCWMRAVASAEQLGVACAAGRGLLFDVFVQNGGWRSSHDERFRRMTEKCQPPPCSRTRLEAIAMAVAAESRAPWRADVLGRKLVFARGWGMVHRRHFDLSAQALT